MEQQWKLGTDCISRSNYKGIFQFLVLHAVYLTQDLPMWKVLYWFFFNYVDSCMIFEHWRNLSPTEGTARKLQVLVLLWWQSQLGKSVGKSVGHDYLLKKWYHDIEILLCSSAALAWHPFHEELFVSGSYDGSIIHWLVGYIPDS